MSTQLRRAGAAARLRDRASRLCYIPRMTEIHATIEPKDRFFAALELSAAARAEI